ncbi:4Fe-4S dicluster domain-containing protein [Heliorestis acidaminivorans]|uniref:4Fe-4S dicluster domain-containing protein n=1 Tax=Heliorestis acidaminivorans TaxID=553427 RepID=A0A6I0EY29_9FIRM|nr:4Fe-4S dicluster domain-containing protein [Heliorestis acidaminivorans]KAB2953311.1 4Fe-4S dicluster domain-containing protein [Heliorestis acidaminivorans]
MITMTEERKEHSFYRIEEDCIGCKFCLNICTWDALDAYGREDKVFQIDGQLCPGCGCCAACCPVAAIRKG